MRSLPGQRSSFEIESSTAICGLPPTSSPVLRSGGLADVVPENS